MRWMYLSCLIALLSLGFLADAEVPASAGEFPTESWRPFRRQVGARRTPATVFDRQAAFMAATAFPSYGHEGVDHSAWYGQSMGVPTFNWGYFGVQGRPYSVTHGSYYNDHSEWGIRGGY